MCRFALILMVLLGAVIVADEHMVVYQGEKRKHVKISEIDSIRFEDTSVTVHEKITRLEDVDPTDSRLLPELFGSREFSGGGIYYFEPGETAHPESHVHDTDELFMVIEGKGTMPIWDVDTFNIQTGDIIWIKAGENHHTTSSVEEPLVTVWFFVDPE